MVPQDRKTAIIAVPGYAIIAAIDSMSHRVRLSSLVDKEIRMPYPGLQRSTTGLLVTSRRGFLQAGALAGTVLI